jgi:hypothetical protein
VSIEPPQQSIPPLADRLPDNNAATPLPAPRVGDRPGKSVAEIPAKGLRAFAPP